MMIDILTQLLETGIISVDRCKLNKEMERHKYLSQHTKDIWQGKNGKWYTTLPDYTKPDGRRLVKRNTKNDILDAIVLYYKSLEERPSLDLIFHKWLEEKLSFNEISKGTYDRYSQDYNRFIKPKDISKRQICDITETDLETLVKESIRDFNLKRKGYSNLRTLLLGTFKYAKKLNYTDLSISSFCSDLDLSQKIFNQDGLKGKQVFDEDEVPRLIEWLNSHPEPGYFGVLLAFQTGIRSGELAALKFNDISNGMLHIQRQEVKFKDDNGKSIYKVVDYTKTENSDRYIYLTESAQRTLKQLKLMNPFSEFIFVENGKKLPKYAFNSRLRTACKQCGIAVRSMHKIRKTYGTVLIDAGVDDSLIMRQMGHKDIQTTRSYYYFANKNSQHQRGQIEDAVSF